MATSIESIKLYIELIGIDEAYRQISDPSELNSIYSFDNTDPNTMYSLRYRSVRIRDLKKYLDEVYKECVWDLKDGVFKTSCYNSYQLKDNDVNFHLFKLCPYCGKNFRKMT